jgi:hypothetical protein
MPYQKVELSGGSDGARSLMIDTIRRTSSFINSRRSSILYILLSLMFTVATPCFQHAYLKINGKKRLNAMLTARACDS